MVERDQVVGSEIEARCTGELNLNSQLRLLFCLVLLAGCAIEQTPQQKDSGGYHQQKVTCLFCGKTNFSVSPNPVSPTTDWCPNDGQICEYGYKLLVEGASMVNPDGSFKPGAIDVEQKIKQHCKRCIGCKMSLFTPETWEAENQ